MARKGTLEERRAAVEARKAAKAAARRVHQYPLRLNEAERHQLDAVAASRGLSPADLLRSAFTSSAPQVSADSAAPSARLLDAAAVSALNRIGANINQIARRLNGSAMVEPGELPDVLHDLNSHLARIEALVFASMDNT